jgi:hypothetical protein
MMSDQDKLRAIAPLVSGSLWHSGGNCWVIRVRNPAFGREEFFFGLMEELVGFDREIDEEHMGSGELRVRSDESPEEIARHINAFLSGPKSYHEGATDGTQV